VQYFVVYQRTTSLNDDDDADDDDIQKNLFPNSYFKFKTNLTESINFYRAMHFSAKRGIAIACRLSVRLSVCVCL